MRSAATRSPRGSVNVRDGDRLTLIYGTPGDEEQTACVEAVTNAQMVGLARNKPAAGTGMF